MADDRPLDSRRELENLRQRYQEHRRTIRHLLQTAPDERLATRYEATLTELQKSIDQLDRIDRETPVTKEAPFDPNQTRSIMPEATGAAGLDTLSARPTKSFEDTELSNQNRSWKDPVVRDQTAMPEADETRRSGSIVSWIAGLIVLAAIVLGIYLFWPDGDRTANDEPIVTDTVLAEDDPAPEPEPPPSVLSIEPAVYDYGIVQKGTRVVHRFTIRNRTDQALSISVERSECRCLWYDYPREIPAGGSVELAVTVDGARAETGTLAQTIVVSSEALPDARAEIDLTAEISQ